jgi:predicted nucleotidyltransferase
MTSMNSESYHHVIYNTSHWMHLKKLRKKALDIMSLLKKNGINSIIYGSVARGDVKKGSDVDVFIPRIIPSFLIESTLSELFPSFYKRELVQATPSYIVKAYIFLDEITSVSFPLLKMRKEEIDFYKLAGQLSYEELLQDKRVPGIRKDLIFINPVEDGHIEFSIKEMPEMGAKILGIDVSSLRKRINVLVRRKLFGKTGVFKSIILSENESFESILNKLINEVPALRRRIQNQRE